MSILLIFPPFLVPGKQYLAMPTLLAYLRSRNVPVTVLDANNEFYFRFLAPEHFHHSKSFAEERFQVLNEKSELSFREIIEYMRVVRTLNVLPGLEQSLERIIESDPRTPFPEKRQSINNAIELCSLPFFPEVLDVAYEFQYFSLFSEYCSQDILRSPEHPGIYSDILRKLVSQALADQSYKIIGISVCFPSQVFPAFFCAHLIKQMNPEVHVTMGGSFISTHVRNLREPHLFRLVDSFVLDDGEIPLERLYEELSSPHPRMERVPGLIYLSDGKVKKNEPPPFIDLELLPPPDYSFVSNAYHVLSGGTSPVLFRLSRGCHWARCAFCRTKLPSVRHHQRPPADHLYRQLRIVMEQTGSRFFHFSDDSAPPDLLEDLCQKMLKDNLKIGWITSLRFDPSLTIERCMMFCDAGCMFLNLGIESPNDRLLRLMDKGINLRLIERVLSNMSWAGLKPMAFMMVGFPTETEEEALAGFARIEDWVRKNFLGSYKYNAFLIFPHSPVFQNPERFGITKLAYPEYQDLDPPITEFDAPGMKREKAFQLSKIFNDAMHSSQERQNALVKNVTELPINGKTVSLHYDMKALYTLSLNASRFLGYNSLSRWLDEYDRAIMPLKRSC